MVMFILCPECSEYLGSVYPLFTAVKIKFCKKMLMNQEHSIDIDKMDFRTDILPKMDKLLDLVDIKNMCCRTHIIGASDFDIDL
jgi:DNA-directed RNA polymerase subunit N (RpoN/RPB10)